MSFNHLVITMLREVRTGADSIATPSACLVLTCCRNPMHAHKIRRAAIGSLTIQCPGCKVRVLMVF